MRIGRNALWNIGEIIAASVALFLLFKVIVHALGIEALGVWSLVLATTSLARLADVGVTGGVGKFVAQTSVQRERDPATHSPLAFIETAIVANALLYAAIALVAYWPARQGILAVLEGAPAEIAVELLPYALLSFALGSMSGTVGAGLLGLNRSDLKSQIMIGGYVLQLIVTVALIPELGLPGVAVGQIAQHLAVTLVAWLLASREAEGTWRLQLPVRLSMSLLRPLVSYGIRLQGVTLASFLYEPAVKFLIAAVGGAAALGLFEMAFRLITQSRQFLAAPCQNLLPLYVATYERGGGLRTIYGPATIIVAILAAAGLLCLVLATPWISLIWIGRVEPLLVSYVAMLAGGWLLNMAAMPAFYLGMASGHLRWNILGSGLTTLGAVLIGKVLGSHFGAAGVVAASSFSVALGAVVIAIGNTRAAGIALIPAFTSVSTLVNAVTGRLTGRA